MTDVTLNEIAAALGIAKRSAERRANRSGWAYKEERVRGGTRRLYYMAALPAEVTDAIKRTRALEEINQAAQYEPAEGVEDFVHQPDREAQRRKKEQGLSRLAGLPDNDPRKRRARAREWVLCRWTDYAASQSTSMRACVQEFVNAYKAGDIHVPEHHLEMLPQLHGVRSLNGATLYRWRKQYREQGLAGLMDGYGNRKAAFKVGENEDLKNVVVGCLIQQPHIKPRDVKAYIEAKHPELDLASEKSIERFIKWWKQENHQVWTQITNPDKWKNEYMVAHGSHHEHVQRLNQLWEMDSTPADWMLADGRHNVVGAIDMYSRRLRFVVSKTSNATALGLTFRRCVLDWGVPETVRTDNGSDYVSQQFRTVLRDLEIEHQLCMPFASEQKGTIERAMRTMSHGVLDLLPGFIGHSVAERKEIEARKSFADRVMTPGETVEVEMTAGELQEKLDQWCDHVYMHNTHSGLNASPWDIVTQWRQPVRHLQDARALDALLAEIGGTRTVTKKGIKFEHHFYIAPELAEYTNSEVFLRRDPDDIGKLFVYNLDGEFICQATAHEIEGISRKEAAAAARHHQKRFLAQQRQQFREVKKAARENIADVVLQHRINTSEKITALPQPSEPYSTPALEQHGRAARSGDDIQPTERDTSTDDSVRRLQEEMEAAPAKAEVVHFQDPMAEYAHWCQLHQRTEAGEHLTEQERRFYENYAQTDEYERMKQYFEEFGLDATEYQA